MAEINKKRGGKREGSGRKRKDPKVARAYKKLISCNVTEEEYNFIKECAEKENITVYALVKQAVFTYIKDKRYCGKKENL